MSSENLCNVKFKVMGVGKPAERAGITVYLKLAYDVDIARLRDKETGEAPKRITGVVSTGSDGIATIQLWPNTRANFDCEYWVWVNHGSNRSQQRIGDIPDTKDYSIVVHV